MTRPRWHDALIVVSIVAVFGLGIWALWWDDVRGFMGWGAGSSEAPAQVGPGQT